MGAFAFQPKRPIIVVWRESLQTRFTRPEMPSPFAPPSGCVFHPRCPAAFGLCPEREPLLKTVDEQQVACLLYETTTAAA